MENIAKLRVVFEPLQLRLKLRLLKDLPRVAHITLDLYLTRLGELGWLEV